MWRKSRWGLAQARDPQLAAWIEAHATFRAPWSTACVPAATPETLQEIADQFGVFTIRALSPANRSASG